MNPATLCRLKKEARALLPFWGAIAAWMVVPVILRLHEAVAHSFAGYVFGCVLLGPACVGHEFHDRTMGLLLSQPVSRRRLWWEKLAVLGAAMLSLALLLLLLSPFDTHTDLTKLKGESFEHILAVIGCWTLPMLLGFCTGPALTLLARSTIGGVALTFLCPWALSLPLWLFLPDDQSFKSGQFTTGEVMALFLSLFVAPCLYMGGLVLLGCWRFQRFEDANTFGHDVSMPAQLTRPFAWLTERLTLGRGSALGNLVRKELRLQQPAFIIAALLVALWLAFVALLWVKPEMEKGLLMVPAILLCFAVPVVAGVISTAEERGLGVHEWQLTLPVSASRQWFVKVLVVLGVNFALGLILPGLLGHASGWVLGDNRMLQGIPGTVSPFLIANLVILAAALYASSASSSSLRAIVGTIVLFVAGAMIGGPFLELLAGEGKWIVMIIGNPLAIVSWFLPDPLWLAVVLAMAYGGLVALAMQLCWIGLVNFRHSVESLRRPVVNVAWLFVAICLYAVVIRTLILLDGGPQGAGWHRWPL